MTPFEIYLITSCDTIRIAFFLLAFLFFFCTLSCTASPDYLKLNKRATCYLIASIFFAILVAIIPSSRRAAYIFNLSTAVRHEDTILQKLGQQYIKEIQFIGDNR